jgi:ribosomal-protein-serine acetyltransferase
MKKEVIIKRNDELNLKQIELTDAQGIFKAINSERVYLGKWAPFINPSKSLKEIQTFIESAVNASEKNGEHVFAIQSNGEFAGLLGFKSCDLTNKKAEIAYWLSDKYLAQDVLLDSVKSLLDFAFNTMQLNRIEIKCEINNFNILLIPKKLGFVLEGTERKSVILDNGSFTDLQVYSLLKTEHAIKISFARRKVKISKRK